MISKPKGGKGANIKHVNTSYSLSSKEKHPK
jgi:hypothetical protein